MKTLTTLIALIVLSLTSAFAAPVCSPSSASVCIGTYPSITFSGCDHYTSSPIIAGIGTISNTATLTVYTYTTTNFIITGYNADGSVCGTSVLPVNILYGPAFNLTPGITDVCQGDSTLITASNPGATYTWAPAAGLSATTGQSVYAKPNVTTVYTCTATNPATGCSAENVVVINVSSIPAITIVNGTSGTVCAGSYKLVTVRKTGIGGYMVTPIFGQSQINDSTFALAPTTTATYSFTPLGPTGCVGAYITYTLTVSNPAAGSIASSQGTNLCAGASSMLTVSYNPAYTYAWVADPTLVVGTANTAVVTPTATKTYSCNVTNGTCTVVKTITINVAGTAPALSLNTYATAICSGTAANLSATATAGATITWGPATGLNTTTGANVIAQPTTNTVYTVTASNGGCANTKIVAVSVLAAVSLTVPVAQINLCPNERVLSDLNELTSNAGNTSYTWEPAAYVISQSANNGEVYLAPTTSTVFTVTATNGACSATATVDITVLTPASLSIGASSVDVVAGNSYTVNAASNAAMFQWLPATGVSNPNVANATITPTATQTYTLIAYEGVGHCATKAELAINLLPFKTTAIVESASIENAYPNPATNDINIKMTNIVNGQALLMDMNGRTLATQTIENKEVINFDLADVTNGAYIVKVINEANEVSNIKFVKSAN